MSIYSIVDTTQIDIDKIAGDDQMARDVLKEKNNYVDKKGGGYSIIGSN